MFVRDAWSCPLGGLTKESHITDSSATACIHVVKFNGHNTRTNTTIHESIIRGVPTLAEHSILPGQKINTLQFTNNENDPEC